MVPAPFIVVVDANVLFPLTLRDTVLRAAAAGFYQLRWSAEILDEMASGSEALCRTSSLPFASTFRRQAHVMAKRRPFIGPTRSSAAVPPRCSRCESQSRAPATKRAVCAPSSRRHGSAWCH
jgi:hypothetical protein